MTRINARNLFLAFLAAVLLTTASATTKTTHTQTTTKHAVKHTFMPMNAGHGAAPVNDGHGAAPTASCTSKFKTHKLAPTPTPGKNKCKSFTDTFTSKDTIVLEENFNGKNYPKRANWVDISGTNGKDVVIGKDGLELLLSPPTKGNKLAFATTLTSVYTLQYGTVIADMKMNETPGFVNAFIIISKAGDEMDWEFVGKEPTTGQSNFYFQGYPFYGVNAGHHKISGGLNSTFHKFGFHWSPELIQWSIDGVVVRTSKKADTWNACDKKYHFPYQAGNIQLGVWDGSDTSGWAHGPIEWKQIKKPLIAYVKSVTVSCDPQWNIKA